MLALLLALCSTLPAPLDVVELVDGTKVEGRVVFDGTKRVVVRNGSRDREIERAKVANVRSASRSLNEMLDTLVALETNDRSGLLALAQRAQSAGLVGESQVLGYKVLALDPTSDAAHELCGHEKRGKEWTARVGGKKYPFDRLSEVRKDFGDGWSFTTTHYEVRTNLPLAQACDVALELELTYRAFFESVGHDIELYEVVEPMKAQIHAEAGSFPEVNDRTGYFSGADNVLFVLAERGADLWLLAHESTHQVMFNTARGMRGGRGEIPAWLDEGFAEYLASSRGGEAGRAVYSFGARSERHFAAHASSDKPYDLSRVLTFGTGDFMASSKSDLKYAQSYTLVHFCLHGRDELHRRGFLEFMRRAYLGQGSTTDFKDALVIKEREFEPTWSEYVGRRKK